ncbi:MAG: Ig-like domain-containing protein, partial [Planctomycetota bacterium]
LGDLGLLKLDFGSTNDHVYAAHEIGEDDAFMLTGTTSRFGDADSLFAAKLNLQDLVGPQLVKASFAFEQGQEMKLSFDEPLDPASLQSDDVVLLNLATDQTIDSGLVVSLSDDQTAVLVRRDLPAGLLPDGNYRLTLAAGAVQDTAGNPQDSDVTLDFFILAGDANRDRSVDLADFLILRQNFGNGSLFSEGDFNYDGAIDLADFLILRGNFNASLPAPGASLFAGGDGKDDGEGNGGGAKELVGRMLARRKPRKAVPFRGGLFV